MTSHENREYIKEDRTRSVPDPFDLKSSAVIIWPQHFPLYLGILPVISGDIWLLCHDDMPSSKMEVDFIPGG